MIPSNGRSLETILILFSITSLDAYWFPLPTFEIYHPKGVTIWIPKYPGIVGFEIKLCFNEQYLNDGEACEMHLKTSTLCYGKFMVNDDNAYIRIGDRLQCFARLHYSNGSKVTLTKQFIVREYSFVHPKVSSTICTKGTQQAEVVKLKEEINLLERIIDGLIHSTSNGTEVTNNLFLTHRPAAVILDSSQLYTYILDRLQEGNPKVNWKTVLVKAFYYNNGVGFEVKTLLDKLKILEMFKNFDRFSVIDLDRTGEVETDDDDNDEDSPVMFHRRGNPGDV